MKSFFSLIFLLFLGPFVASAQQDWLSYSVHELDSLFINAHQNKRTKELLPIAQAAVSKAKKEFGKQDSVYARMLYHLATAIEKVDINQARLNYEEVRNIQAVAHPNSRTYANTLNSLGILYYKIANYPEAEKLWLAAKELRLKLLGPQHKEHSSSLNNLALLYSKIGRYKEAEMFYKEALKIKKETLGPEHESYANSLGNLALLYLNIGRYEQAVELYLQSLAIYEKTIGNQHPSYAISLINLANSYSNMGQDQKAEPYFVQATKIHKASTGAQSPRYASSLLNLANLYNRLKAFEQAEPLLLQAMEIYSNVFGKKHPEYALCLDGMAEIHNQTGRNSEEPFLRESLEIRAAVYGPQHPLYILSLNNLADWHYKKERNDEAEKLYLEVLQRYESSVGKKHPFYASSLNNLARLYQELARYDEAKKLLSEALEIRAQALGTQHPDYIESLNSFSNLYLHQKDFDPAWKYLEQAIHSNSSLTLDFNIDPKWLETLIAADYNSIFQMNVSLTFLYNLLERDPNRRSPQKQAIIAELGVQLLQKNRASFGEEADKLRSLGQSSDWVHYCLSVLDHQEQAQKAFEIAAQNKSVLLLESTHSQEAHSFGNLPDSLIEKEREFQKNYAQAKAALVENRSEEVKAGIRVYLNDLSIEMDAFKKSIQEQFPKYAQFQYEQNNLAATEIQALLDEKTAMIEYVIGDSTLYVFYLSKTDFRFIKHPCDIKDFKRKIKSFHQVLSNYRLLANKSEKAYQQYTQLAHWFYKNTVAIALETSSNIEQLIFICDGELGQLPFEAFLVEAAPQSESDYGELHYLVKDYSIAYNYSAQLWKNNKENPPASNNKEMLAMAANYSYTLDSNQMHLRLPIHLRMRNALDPLPEARKEIEDLSQKFQGFFAFDHDASESFFKEKAGDYAVIHLAMHGLLNQRAPLLSSLAFSEDSDSLENNFLQAYEISKLQLHADLIVLSACETGFGKFEKGNGLASLARAFMYAGASSLVVSLWQVNDHSTSMIMQSFYEQLSRGLPKSEALRQAKLTYLEQSSGLASHPAFWSPFIQLGDDRPIELATKKSSWPWFLGAGLLLLILMLGLRWKQKAT